MKETCIMVMKMNRTKLVLSLIADIADTADKYGAQIEATVEDKIYGTVIVKVVPMRSGNEFEVAQDLPETETHMEDV